ncbi:MAG: methyltransferase domain-containing protein [Candidatus Methylacidiphilales bacterium]|nr:methyltransferase domain-containing protein [Candidatus Methylacidiphilales bacterium]
MCGLDSTQTASREQFDRQSAAYGAGHILSQTSDLESALPHLGLRAGMKAIDVATGAGHTAVFFAHQGLVVTAADIAPGMLVQTRTLAADAGVALETREHPAESLPYADGEFDLLTCRIAAHHFSCPATFCMETARVLKPGGKLLLIDGTVEDGHPVAEAWIHEIEKLRDPSHGRFITPQKWIHLCGHVGLKVTHSEIQPMKQPDLEWYFTTANTSPENRRLVRERIRTAPAEARELFHLDENDQGKTTWWWQRLVIVAVKL